MVRLLRSAALFAALVVLWPTAAQAQASIAGVVKDASGAVLPGVTVEASSPALIEKVRSVTTDDTGQYQIVDLRPGVYAVTFTLTGFSTVRREGIELTGSGTTTVSAELKVGTVAETVTVTGESPIVDVQTASRQVVLSGEAIASTPAARSWNGILLLQPGITGDPNQVQLTPSMIAFGIHGGPTLEGRLLVDGMNVGASRGGGGVSGYTVETSNLQEVTFRSSGGLGEAETGGPYMNVIPKTGGNTYHGSFVESFSNSSLQGSNYSDELKAKGLRVPGQLINLYDHSFALGGPFMKDRLWFYEDLRYHGQCSICARHVRQRQRRRRHEVDVRAEHGAPGPCRPILSDGQHAPDVAGLPAQQAESVLGRTAQLHRSGVAGCHGHRRVPRESGRLGRGWRRRHRNDGARDGGLLTRPVSGFSRRAGHRRCRTRRCSTSGSARTARAGAGIRLPGVRPWTSSRSANKAEAFPVSAIAPAARCAAEHSSRRPAGSWRTPGTRTSRMSRARTTSRPATTVSTTTTTSSRTSPTPKVWCTSSTTACRTSSGNSPACSTVSGGRGSTRSLPRISGR